MIVKGLVDEDFTNYKKPSMFVICPYCSFKCDKEAGCSICQNSSLAHEPDYYISAVDLVARYATNPIPKALVFGGLEPMDSIDELYSVCKKFREHTNDDIVIYTGYTEEEFEKITNKQRFYDISNIIIKFGRFIPNQEKHYDEILGVELASSNQYARRIS